MSNRQIIEQHISALYGELLTASKRINKRATFSEDVVHDIITAVLQLPQERVVDVIKRGKFKPYLIRAIVMRSINERTRKATTDITQQNFDEITTEHSFDLDVRTGCDWFDGTIIQLKVEGYNIREISEMTGITKRNIEQAINRARIKIKEALCS